MTVTVAWFSYFPIEWLPDLTPRLGKMPRQHPATWQRVLLAELERQPKIRLHIIVLRKHFARSESFERNGVVFHLVKTPGGLRAPSLFWIDTVLIRRVLRRIRPDVVHAWGTENGAALVAARVTYPAVVTMQGLLNWLGEIVPLNAYHRLAARLESWSLRRASVVTAESAFAVDYLRRRYPHLDLHQIEHAPLPMFHEIVRLPQTNPVRLLYVGGVGYAKGADVMLEALAGLDETIAWELVLVGQVEGETLEELKRRFTPAFWSRLKVRGTLTADEIARELAVATLMIYPTRCDNSPNAVKEAVVAGVPVVASRIGGIVDYVWPRRNGCLFAAGDVAACRQAIQEALADPRFGAGLVDAATLSEVRVYLSAEGMARRFFDLYCRVGRAGGGSYPNEREFEAVDTDTANG